MKERATLAQMVERLIRNQQVSGSIPEGGSSASITSDLLILLQPLFDSSSDINAAQNLIHPG